ncbi:hypothetical protein [Buttiauxella sp. B2]|nr:hypothetical protein [Buttiauxella sp. B2]
MAKNQGMPGGNVWRRLKGTGNYMEVVCKGKTGRRVQTGIV